MSDWSSASDQALGLSGLPGMQIKASSQDVRLPAPACKKEQHHEGHKQFVIVQSQKVSRHPEPQKGKIPVMMKSF